MDIAKFGSRMTAVVAGLMLIPAAWSAEAPARSLPKAAERPALQGLSNPALHLTDAQKARIDQIVNAYLAEDQALARQFSAAGATPGKEVAAARKQVRDRMNAAVDQVLNASQRQTLKTDQAARTTRTVAEGPPLAR